jgi:hypothetical protein
MRARLDSEEGQQCLDEFAKIIPEWAAKAMPTELLQAMGTAEGGKLLQELWPDIVNAFFKAHSSLAPRRYGRLRSPSVSLHALPLRGWQLGSGEHNQRGTAIDRERRLAVAQRDQERRMGFHEPAHGLNCLLDRSDGIRTTTPIALHLRQVLTGIPNALAQLNRAAG